MDPLHRLFFEITTCFWIGLGAYIHGSTPPPKADEVGEDPVFQAARLRVAKVVPVVAGIGAGVAIAGYFWTPLQHWWLGVALTVALLTVWWLCATWRLP